MTKMLGRRPPKNAPALKFADHLVAVPDHPIADLAPDLSWPMDRNDEAGDCVVAGLDHALQAIHSQLGVVRTAWGDSTLLSLYQTQNPGFTSWSQGGTSVDGGMEIQGFLEYLVKQKLILGFAKVDHSKVEEMKAAVYLGLATITGETLTERNLNEQTWDYYAKDQVAGGHCTTSVGYKPTENQVSWGALYSMTDRFLAKRVEEAWFIVTQAHVDHPAFREGFNLDSFAAAFEEITGGAPFPAVTPTPPVTPPVVPPVDPPAGNLVLDVPDAVMTELEAKAAKSKTHPDVQSYAEHAIEQYLKK